MKKFVMTLVACFACMQSVQAIPSNLGESLLEYQAILNTSLISATIPQDEAIIDIKRQTKDLMASIAYYEIKTYIPIEENFHSSDYETSHSHHRHSQNQYQNQFKKYIVRVVFTPNPQIGPRIITVESIRLISKNCNEFFESVEASE